MAKDLTPDSFKIIPLKKKILPDEGDDVLGGTIGGLGQTKTSYVDSVINKSRQALKLSTLFETSSRFLSTVVGTGVVEYTSGSGLEIKPGITSGSYGLSQMRFIEGDAIGIKLFDDTAFVTFVQMTDVGGGTSGDNGAFYIGVKDTQGTLNGTTLDLSGIDQYGFKAIMTDGVVTLYATSSNDAGSETTTLLGTVVLNEAMLLTAHTDGTTVRFSVASASINETASHITNVPDSTATNIYASDIFVNNSNTPNQFEWFIGTYTFEKFTNLLV